MLRKRSSRSSKVDPALQYGEDGKEVATENEDVLKVMTSTSHDQLRKFQDELRESSASSSTFRERLEYALATSRSGMLLDAANAILTITACALYVAETYVWSRQDCTLSNSNERNGTLRNFVTADLCLSIVFAIDFALHFFVAHKRLVFIVSAQGIIELATTLPGFLCEYMLLNDMYTVCDLRKEVYTMTLSVLYLIFFASGVLHLVENTEALWQNGAEMTHKSFFDINYLIVTTITTVGYGDVVPETMLGRAVIMGMMCTTVILVPKQTNKLVALMAMTSVYARQSYNRKGQTSHIVVSGDVHGRAILDFFREFFHPDHGNTNQGAVIIGEGLPSPEIRSLLSDPRFAYMITYLDGTVMLDRDLSRAALEDAEGIFLLTNKHSRMPQHDDASCILRALSVHRYLQKRCGSHEPAGEASLSKESSVPSLPGPMLRRRTKKPTLCIQLLQSESRRLFESSRRQIGHHDLCHTQLVCIDEIKNNIMAKSCLVPGLTTMINNLVASSEEPTLSSNEAPWLHEYAEGVGYEMYRIELSEYLQGLPFSSMAEEVYLATGVLVFALELAHVRAGSYVALNPGRFVIPHAVPELAIFAIVLAGDLDEALVISTSDKVTEEIRDKVFQNITLSTADQEGFLPPQPKNDRTRMSMSAHLPRLFAGFSRGSSTSLIGSEMSQNGGSGRHLNVSQRLLKIDNDEDTAPTLSRRQFSSQMLGQARHSMSFRARDGLHREFYAAEEPSTLEERQLSSCGPDFNKHIVVFGEVSQLYNFVLPLRRKKLGEIVPIVVVHTRLPSEQEWQAIARFDELYFMQGSSLDVHDLRRVSIRHASRAVLFAKVNELGQMPSEALVDADSVFAYSIIAKDCPDVQINVELAVQTNISYLADEDKLRSCGIKASDRYMYVPPFAAGQIYTSSVLDTLSGQSYYNHKLIDILHQLVIGQSPESASRWQQETGHLVANAIHSSELHMIPVPPELHNKTYGDLVGYLNKQEIIPLGLRRGVLQERQNVMPYVVTNPPRDMEIKRIDKVFVLSREPPVQRVSQRNLLGDEGLKCEAPSSSNPEPSLDTVDESIVSKGPSSRRISVSRRASTSSRISSRNSRIFSQESLGEGEADVDVDDEHDDDEIKAALSSFQTEMRTELASLSSEMRVLLQSIRADSSNGGDEETQA
ncbi:Calcium-activated potassium channel subunit alpha-1 [Hondaea fermentalgiana]|uniref:Calcium-activated potassium channel subunit alpha-1 n=1 Tax=Hondaea fermentalgiana TaxID=2315210 RepID=A0A2R5GLW5_9STRA|nr:Calcium-activated potassium channel subunit alpha-1 [Hondaea fermentalgiana]|eukprot:GBG31892.1 Calcium-activated potassium channel subunit alpha-1 [Hondaea fermentalgiana]